MRVNRMIIKPKRTSGEGSLYFHFDENNYLVTGPRNEKGMRDSKRSCKSFKRRSASKHSLHKRRIRSIRRRDPLKEELPRREKEIGYTD